MSTTQVWFVQWAYTVNGKKHPQGTQSLHIAAAARIDPVTGELLPNLTSIQTAITNAGFAPPSGGTIVFEQIVAEGSGTYFS